VLVDGAGGFLGGFVVAALCRAGYDVRATDLPGNDGTPALSAGAQWVEADLLDVGAVRRLVAGCQAVVHVAGLFDFSLPWEVLYAANVDATTNLCDAALESGVDKFVHVSSTTVYGTPEMVPVREDSRQNPKNDYGTTKQRGEQEVWRYQRFRGLPASVVRPASIYGPRSRYIIASLFAIYSLSAEHGYTWLPQLDGGARCHHVHVEDVAEAIRLVLAETETVGRAYNVADETPLAWGEITQLIANLTNASGRVYRAPRFVMRALGAAGALWPSSSLVDLNRSFAKDWAAMVDTHGLADEIVPRVDRDFFGYAAADHIYDTSALSDLGMEWGYPRTVDGIRATFDWYCAHGWLPGPGRRGGAT
jgi:nucleoside-diphosphate-sugar epimerase